uniref:G domain-containing protein n=1 Tax=Acrobeloides nanus TaxID=290746 RepID=A0A914BXR8_9BILA
MDWDFFMLETVEELQKRENFEKFNNLPVLVRYNDNRFLTNTQEYYPNQTSSSFSLLPSCLRNKSAQLIAEENEKAKDFGRSKATTSKSSSPSTQYPLQPKSTQMSQLLPGLKATNLTTQTTSKLPSPSTTTFLTFPVVSDDPFAEIKAKAAAQRLEAEKELEKQQNKLRSIQKLPAKISQPKKDVKIPSTSAMNKERPNWTTNNSGNKPKIQLSNIEVPERIEHVFVIPPESQIKSVGFMGLLHSGKTRLVTALAGIKKEDMKKEYVELSQTERLYEIHHPGGGFIGGSIDANRERYTQFFENSQLNNLNCLCITINGKMCEEDILVAQVAREKSIPFIILATCSDIGLKNYCEGRTPNENDISKYLQEERRFIQAVLNEVDTKIASCPLFFVSGIVINSIVNKLKNMDEMKNYVIDERKLVNFMENNCSLNLYRLKIALDSINYDHDDKQRQYRSSDKQYESRIIFVGRQNSGKSTILDALRNVKASDANSATHRPQTIDINGHQIIEISYTDLDPIHSITKNFGKYEFSNPLYYYLVIENHVGEKDLELLDYLTKNNLPFSILLTKTDQHLDSLAEDKNIDKVLKNNYKQNRFLTSAKEFQKIGINGDKISLFFVSSPVIRDFICGNSRNECYELDEALFIQHFKNIII